jgi:molecular chaperone GrpE
MSQPHNPHADGPRGATAEATDADSLRERLAAVERERDQYLELLQRTRADFDNYQKRSTRDAQQERRYAQVPLATDLLPALDNLDRALAAARQAGDAGPLAQGVGMVQTQLLDALRRHGITPVAAQGQPFDPNVHQAVMQQPSADQPPGTVLQVLQPGFQVHDRVLRPASVIVSTDF